MYNIKGGIHALEGLIFNDLDDPTYHVEEKMSDAFEWEG